MSLGHTLLAISAHMDGTSPIEEFLTGRLSEDELLAEVDRVMVEGSQTDRTRLIGDWRTKSGRIRDLETRRKLDARVHPLSWQAQVNFGDVAAAASWGTGKSLQPGDVLAGRFVIEAKIGSGGMGTVFKARDLRREEAQDRHPYVAVKTLNIDVLQRDDSLKILQREARKAQGLAHPNIVRVHDFDRDGSTLFLTMELLEGTSLSADSADERVAGCAAHSFVADTPADCIRITIRSQRRYRPLRPEASKYHCTSKWAGQGHRLRDFASNTEPKSTDERTDNVRCEGAGGDDSRLRQSGDV